MSERLIIRLASEASQKQHWLIWSESEKEIIASGELENAQYLKTLTDKAQSRQVICLLPGVDVAIKEVVINGTFNRQMQQALPYLIEEELACDIEKSHLTVIAKHPGLVHVAVCDKQRIANWLAWLADANINCKQFIPEGLALPVATDNNWQALQLDNDWIIRESQYVAWSCEASMLEIILASKMNAESEQTIKSYSALPTTACGDWLTGLPVLPMELLATGALQCKVNLLSGEFKIQKEANTDLLKWRLPAIFVALLFVMSCINLYLEKRTVDMQTEATKKYVEEVYKLAFPKQNKVRYLRMKRAVTSMLNDIGGESGSANFLLMLAEIAPSFKNNKQLSLSNLKYDASEQEMRILAVGDNFQTFETFSSMLPKQYNLQQGALNSSNNQVSGLLTIRKE
ncbi:MAG: type II secretion system protein GspL [Psychromonas sp.]